jgi:hypothetical protein
LDLNYSLEKKTKSMRLKLAGLLALVAVFTAFSSFVSDDEGSSDGQGFGYSYSDVECPKDQWAMVTTTTNSSAGASGSVYVTQGQTIPGTSVVAGVSGYYVTGTISQYSNLRETYKGICTAASWYNYCSGPVSCRVIFPN